MHAFVPLCPVFCTSFSDIWGPGRVPVDLSGPDTKPSVKFSEKNASCDFFFSSVDLKNEKSERIFFLVW